MKLILAIANIIEWPFGKFSLVGNSNFFDQKHFPWVANIEAHWQEILEEVKPILAERDSIPSFQEISPDQKVITQDNHWKTFFLYGYGHRAEKNCLRCPKTTALMEKIPGMKTAFFSILSPGKYIPEHRGPYKGVLRYHLGLIIPEPKEKCWIRVGDTVTHWEAGKSLVFDDAFPHEVWNDTDGERIILFVDFVRPLPPWMDKINNFIIDLIGMSPFVKKARENFTKL